MAGDGAKGKSAGQDTVRIRSRHRGDLSAAQRGTGRVMALAKPMSATKSAAKRMALRLPAPILSATRYATIRPLRAYIRYAPWSFGKKILWNRLISHFRWLESTLEPTAEVSTFFDSTILVDPHDMCGRFIYYFGLWEPNLTHWISQRLEDGDVFV